MSAGAEWKLLSIHRHYIIHAHKLKVVTNLMVLVVYPFVATLNLQMSVAYLLMTHHFHIVLTALIIVIIIIIIIIIIMMSHNFYSKTNQMHQSFKFILFLKLRSTCFRRSFLPSSGIQDCTYSNRYMSVRYCWLLATKQTVVSVWHTPVAVCTVLNSWWRTERPSETCRA